MSINNQREYFDKTYKKWVREVSPFEKELITQSFNNLGIAEGDNVLDVGCGTGVLYELLQGLKINNYVGLDISNKMLEQFTFNYPEVRVRCDDFNSKIEANYGLFDYIIIYNSIPHFDNLDSVFYNARNCLNVGGIFSIIHARTRKGLREHHERLGYKHLGEPIPSDQMLMKLSNEYGFHSVIIKDEDYFYFTCSK